MLAWGFDTALSEITLVLFTTLAPSGIIAFMLMCLPLLGKKVTDDERARLSKFLCIPLVVSLGGLVASATHLGNPANALYVFMGVGRSPLSNEVFCAALFLGCAALYWLYSFSQHPHALLQRGLIVLAWLTGAAAITAIAFAYQADTIITWRTAYVPLALWLNSLVGGPLLTFFSIRVAGYQTKTHRFGHVLLAVSAMALAANLVVYGLQVADLGAMQNSLATMGEFTPLYTGMIAAFAVLSLAGLVVDGLVMLPHHHLSPTRAACACLLALAGIFIMRFGFYMMHMTVGLGV